MGREAGACEKRIFSSETSHFQVKVSLGGKKAVYGQSQKLSVFTDRFYPVSVIYSSLITPNELQAYLDDVQTILSEDCRNISK